MKKITYWLIFSTLLILLTACQPRVFGVPQSTWNTLTPAQKQEVIRGYNERKQIQEENAPIQNAIDTAGIILNTPRAKNY